MNPGMIISIQRRFSTRSHCRSRSGRRCWPLPDFALNPIDYADEAPDIRETFASELAKHGLSPRMDAAYAAEQVELAKKAG